MPPAGGDAHALLANNIEAYSADLTRLHSIHGPSLRMVVDLHDLAQGLVNRSSTAGAYVQVDTGVSGNMASAYYTDQREMFRPTDGSRVAQMRQMSFSRGPQPSDNTLVLRPRGGGTRTVEAGGHTHEL
eukprot:EC714567.1.p2 GENE.EC714567.1~~EC714567.1.p2  ORF type:complete len:129 (+),score=35.11 EC714567.1:3-389(+)